eukprot:scaffold1314_cov386-Pavlova_lutheri.AAC.15
MLFSASAVDHEYPWQVHLHLSFRTTVRRSQLPTINLLMDAQRPKRRRKLAGDRSRSFPSELAVESTALNGIDKHSSNELGRSGFFVPGHQRPMSSAQGWISNVYSGMLT